jgi:serine protease SohB
MKELYGEKVRFLPYGMRRPLLQRLGAKMLGGMADEIEERAHWARFGL